MTTDPAPTPPTEEPHGEVALTEFHAVAAGRTIQLVPVEVFGQFCDHDDHKGEQVPFGWGLCDAVSAWSDCNRAARRIFRVEDLPGPRAPEDTITVWASDADLAKLNRDWGDGYNEDPPTLIALRAEIVRLRSDLNQATAVVEAAKVWRDCVAGLILGTHEVPLADAVDACD